MEINNLQLRTERLCQNSTGDLERSLQLANRVNIIEQQNYYSNLYLMESVLYPFRNLSLIYFFFNVKFWETAQNMSKYLKAPFFQQPKMVITQELLR